MNVTFETKALMSGLQAIQAIIAKGPVADKENKLDDCLTADKDSGEVTIESASAGLYAKVTLPAEIEESGKVVFNRGVVANLKLTDEKTNLGYTVDGDGRMTFLSGALKGGVSVSQEFDGMDSARPLNIPDLVAKVPAGTLRQGIKRVVFASNDQEDPNLKIKLLFDGDRMVITAHDSYRAAVFKTKLDKPVTAPQIVIQAGFLKSVIHAIPIDEEISLGLSDKAIRIAGGGIDICHPVLQGVKDTNIEENIEGIEKSEPAIEFMLDVKEAKEAIAGVQSVVPASLGTTIKMDMTVTKSGKATVKVDSAIGSADCRFAVENVTVNDENAKMRISCKYILEFLSLLSDGKALVRVWDRPVIMRSEQYGTTLVMPQLT